MQFDDVVYGKSVIEEDVLRELINSEPVQRLKDINQAGPSPLFMEDKPVVKRFDHSVGVMLLLRENGASVQEQIAGLLHDVPHTAFSHVADFVFETEDHEYHERFMEELIFDSQIPEILERYGYDIDYILDEDNFKLLERDLPKLCADRLDYAMRDLKRHKMDGVQKFRSALTTEDNEFVFDDSGTAEKFAESFIELDETVYASPKEVAIYHLFAEILREMIEQGELEEEELFKTDTYVMEKVRESELDRVKELLKILDSGIKFEVGVEDYDFVGETKARAVDPPFLRRDDKIPVSEESREVGRKIKQHLDNVNEGFKIKIEGYNPR